jgi:hypothetical protein
MGLLADLRSHWAARRAGPQVMLDAAALAVVLDGHVSAREVDAACRLLGDLPWFQDEAEVALRRRLEESIARYRATDVDLVAEAGVFAKQLSSPDGRSVLLGICAFVIYVDEAQVTAQERAWLEALAEALGQSPARLEELLEDIHGWIEAQAEAED